jgi:hypothetical protein
MPCEIMWSEAGQVVILEGHNVRKYFDPARGAPEWEALVASLKHEARLDATVERINGADIETLVANYQAMRKLEAASQVAIKTYKQDSTKRKLDLKELGL